MSLFLMWCAVILGSILLSLLAGFLCACVLLTLWGTPKEGER